MCVCVCKVTGKVGCIYVCVCVWGRGVVLCVVVGCVQTEKFYKKKSCTNLQKSLTHDPLCGVDEGGGVCSFVSSPPPLLLQPHTK